MIFISGYNDDTNFNITKDIIHINTNTDFDLKLVISRLKKISVSR
jgi:hypothetical protein